MLNSEPIDCAQLLLKWGSKLRGSLLAAINPCKSRCVSCAATVRLMPAKRSASPTHKRYKDLYTGLYYRPSAQLDLPYNCA